MNDIEPATRVFERARFMRFIDGRVAYTEHGTLTLTWHPDHPYTLNINIDAETFNVDNTVIDVDILTHAIVNLPNGKFTKKHATARVGIAYAPGLFGVIAETDGGRVVANIQSIDVEHVISLNDLIVHVNTECAANIQSIMDSEIETMFHG